jgi:ADP-dependent NAD(P)H-hydrate dehydratase
VPTELTPAVLAELAPPEPDGDASKHDRGSVLVVGGSPETPGAVLLAGVAALRAGAGRVRIATAPDCTVALGVAFPEARVFALDYTRAAEIAELAAGCDAVLLGPGILDVDRCEGVLDAVTSSMVDGVLVVDAGVLPAAGQHPAWIRRLGGRALLVPNPDEFALLGVEDARSAADRFDAVVSVRGPETWIAAPDGTLLVDRRGTPGLATSGSGDVAAGLAAGFGARGATPVGAAAWSAAVHGRAGERLGPVGFLARELLDEVRPAILELEVEG